MIIVLNVKTELGNIRFEWDLERSNNWKLGRWVKKDEV